MRRRRLGGAVFWWPWGSVGVASRATRRPREAHAGAGSPRTPVDVR